MHPAIFLDRDGVIIENRQNYVRSWSDVAIYPGALKVLAEISTTPNKVIIVTNQSVVGRGFISLAEAEAINKRLVERIVAAGGRVDGVFMCPHRPEDMCYCRKPRPGLLLQAQRALLLNMDRSIMIGDALSDLQAAQAAGVGRCALVRTGRGKIQALQAKAVSTRIARTYDTLADALAEFVTVQM